jgi:pimeloyl-ACP methyl ester carboxylesterase
MHVVSAGQGPVVLRLCGFSGDHTVWRDQIGAPVGAGFRVIAPDSRGGAQTDAPVEVAVSAMDRLCTDDLPTRRTRNRMGLPGRA